MTWDYLTVGIVQFGFAKIKGAKKKFAYEIANFQGSQIKWFYSIIIIIALVACINFLCKYHKVQWLDFIGVLDKLKTTHTNFFNILRNKN